MQKTTGKFMLNLLMKTLFPIQRKTKLTVSQILINTNATSVSQLKGENKLLGKTILPLCQLQLFPES